MGVGAASRVCVIGAGSSGIATCQVLHARGIPFDCFEKGSGVGGNWRYANDNGMSSAYRSLFINTSRRLMEYASYPMPDHYPDYPHHSQIAAYFDDYVDHFGFRGRISFGTEVTAVEPVDPGRRGVGGHARGRGERPLRGGLRRQRPPLGPALPGAALPGRVRGRAAPLAPLPRAGRALPGEERAGARDRQLRDGHRGGDLARLEDDLARHAPGSARDPQVHEGHADRRAGAD